MELADTKANYLQKVEDVPIDHVDELDEAAKKRGCCGKCLHHKCTQGCLKFLFSNAGLCIIVLAYTIGGAFLFIALELPNEKSGRTATREEAIKIEAEREKLAQFVIDYALANRGNNRTDVVDVFKLKLDKYQAMIADAIDIGYDGEVHKEEDEKYDWDVASTILFTASILTTIGYGHISPKTEMGRLVTLLYSVFALPLVSMFIINIGAGIADLVRLCWSRGACYLCWKKRLISHNEWPPKDRRKQQPIVSGLDDPEDDEAIEGRAKSAAAYSRADGDDVVLKDVSELEAPPSVAMPAEVEEDEESEEQPVPTSLTLFIVVFYLAMGTIVFVIWSSPDDEWSLIQSLYFSWVTLSTIGFGDYVPGLSDIDTLSGQFRIVFASFYIIVGLAVIAMGIDLATSVAEDKAKRAKERLDQRREDEAAEKERLLALQEGEQKQNLLDSTDLNSDMTPPTIVH